MTLSAEFVRRSGAVTLDVTVHVDRGETLAIVGPNGAGKTSTLRTLAGLERIDSGLVSWSNEVWDDPSSQTFRGPDERAVGFVFQQFALFDHLSVLDNVAFGLRARGVRRIEARRRASELLDQLSAHALAHRAPVTLSGGEAQKVALARSLAVSPHVLLLDEPFAALDATSRTDARRLLQEQRGDGLARILVTHDAVDALTLADRILVMENGRVTQIGTPDELVAMPRTMFAAEILGLNPLRGRLVGQVLDLGNMTLTVGAHECSDGAVLAVIRPRSVSLHVAQPEGSPRNVWTSSIAGVDRSVDRVRVRLAGPLPIAVEVTHGGFEALGLCEGDTVWASVKASEISVRQG